MMILDKKPNLHIFEYAKKCQDVLGINAELIVATSNSFVKYYTGDKVERDIQRPNMFLEKKWYDSLESGNYDYSVYDDPIYLSDMWACWKIYSRRYLLLLNKLIKTNGSVFKPKNILDLGCGAGLTTSALKQMFPAANVYGTNIENTAQIKLCRVFASEYGFNIKTKLSDIERIDFVFASEYFEHIESPLEELQLIIDKFSPRVFMIANSFNTISLGHFDSYLVNGNKTKASVMSKLFNNILKNNSYTKVKTGWWNNRPSLWIRNEH